MQKSDVIKTKQKKLNRLVMMLSLKYLQRCVHEHDNWILCYSNNNNNTPIYKEKQHNDNIILQKRDC